MKYLISIIFASISLSVDVMSVVLPSSAKDLSSSGYGIASDGAYSINPALLSDNKKTYFEFSDNEWLFDVAGSYLSYTDKDIRLSGHYWQVDDIEMYDNNPSESPVSTFGSKTLFLNVAQGFKINNNNIGYSLKYTYMKLLEYEDKGFVLDFGYQRQFGESVSVGFMIKNLNSGFKNENQIPVTSIIGTSQKIKSFPITLNFDLFYNFSDDMLGSYQGIVFSSYLGNLTAGYRYNYNLEELDTSLGISLLWNNLEFSMSYLIKDNKDIGNPIFYQLSYYL